MITAPGREYRLAIVHKDGMVEHIYQPPPPMRERQDALEDICWRAVNRRRQVEAPEWRDIIDRVDIEFRDIPDFEPLRDLDPPSA